MFFIFVLLDKRREMTVFLKETRKLNGVKRGEMNKRKERRGRVKCPCD